MTYKEATEMLKANDKITVVTHGFVGCSIQEMTLTKDAEACFYAQYTDAMRLTYKVKRKRRTFQQYFYGSERCIIYKGHDLGLTQNPWKAEVNGMQQAKYSSFDKRYFTDLMESSKEVPIFSSIS